MNDIFLDIVYYSILCIPSRYTIVGITYYKFGCSDLKNQLLI